MLRRGIIIQAGNIESWLAGLTADQWACPSVLPGWAVADLAVHVTQVLRTVGETLARPLPDVEPVTAAEYVSGMRGAGEQIRERDRAGGRGPAEVLDALRAEQARAVAALDAVLGPVVGAQPVPPRRGRVAAAAVAGAGSVTNRMVGAEGARAATTIVVHAPRGPLRLEDFLASRAVELVVHTDDLARSVPGQPPPELDAGGLRTAVRMLADLLAAVAPGRSVEVRVPPYAAVQCVEGPRHTRGTPPNVVETDPLTWIRLASGRQDWTAAIADGSVAASGARSDISPYLPLLG